MAAKKTTVRLDVVTASEAEAISSPAIASEAKHPGLKKSGSLRRFRGSQ
jgi:hypothetical protein